ncbi:ATP-dependent DNA helicase SRS2-like protein [Sesamum angolense]|uniref:DNA 3'-5' helicase n=1 Tax=Sesamum angolense TaxID=2727404 RepID=A0AAE1VTR9_9LAMI|nr:ATP-dependent DNA helicase SRS2-like protein [Sesamum angolense]
MNNKENAVVIPAGGELSAEQRARISKSFRAAKALLARKRPRFDSGAISCHLSSNQKSEDEKETKSLVQVDGIKRVPLSKISTNISYQDPLNSSMLSNWSGDDVNNGVKSEILLTPVRQAECRSRQCVGDASSSANELKDEGFGVGKLGLLSEDGSILNSYGSPSRQHDSSYGFKSSLSSNSMKPLVFPDMKDSILTSNFLGDDFEESILEEIDALCEQKSSGNSERDDTTMNRTENEIIVKSCEEDVVITNPQVSYETLKSKEILNSNVDQAFGVERVGKSENKLTKNMPEEYAKYIQSLNDKQQEAACNDISIPLVIVAGPGSGKTSTMVGRVLMLLYEGISPSNILAMTFTTAAAAEMRERIGAIAGKAAAKELTISTFHSFSLQLCRSHAEKIGRTPDFLIYGHGQQRKAIIEAVRLLEDGRRRANNEVCKLNELSDINSPKHFKDKSKKWLKFVTQAKAAGRSPEDFHKMGDETGAIILQNYNDILKSCNALDYHDFISYSVKLLTDFPEGLPSEHYAILLRILASHKRITIVGDEDQSIFSFNGADVCDLIHSEKISQCTKRGTVCFVGDKILEITSDGSSAKCSYGNIAVLYRRQVVRAIIAMLSTTLPGCDDGPFRRVFKALLPFDKEEKKKEAGAPLSGEEEGRVGRGDKEEGRGVAGRKKQWGEMGNKAGGVIEHIDKVSTVRKCSFISAACDIFSAKISGTFKRSQLTQGRKVLLTLDMISKLVHREQSISAVITSVANMIPQKYLLEQRAVLDVDGSKLLNEDNDLRSNVAMIIQQKGKLLSLEFGSAANGSFSTDVINSFGHFYFAVKRLRVGHGFIVKANEAEIPLLHEYNGILNESATSLEEERRLLYVAMTRARKETFHAIRDYGFQLAGGDN